MAWTPERLGEHLPRSLEWLNATEAGREWIRSLPRLVSDCLDLWSLRPVAEPFDSAYVSVAVPVETRERTAAVLKVQFPGRESEHEALALEAWNGDGAVRLHAHDPVRHALLLERCEPGTPLSEAGQSRGLDVIVGLLPRLWKAVTSPPFRSLKEEAAGWASGLPAAWHRAGRPFEESLLHIALDALRSLPDSQGEQVLLHQDLHGMNILAAEREPWLVIDPKPLVGEREFGVAPVVRSFEFGHGRLEVLERLDRLTSELGLDRERARLWTIAQTVAWSIGSDYIASHIETARWLAEAG